MATSYGLQILLARSLGTGGFGLYSYVLAWMGPLAMFAGLGLSTVALRFLPVYRDGRDGERLAGLVRATENIGLAAAIAAAMAGSLLALAFSSHPAPLLVGLWTLPLAVQMNSYSELARSAERFRLAFVLPFFQQLVMLAGAFVLLALAPHGLAPSEALLLPAAGTLCVLPFQRTAFRRGMRRELGGEVLSRPRYELRNWIALGLAFVAIDASET
ncbi:MAG: Polysaccharide biosynthesis protein, partial [Acidimicrobiaceae bacterium]|nr:Polysaccharide biosynthesis protein [Acidimicrobiaceae bacterium]